MKMRFWRPQADVQDAASRTGSEPEASSTAETKKAAKGSLLPSAWRVTYGLPALRGVTRHVGALQPGLYAAPKEDVKTTGDKMSPARHAATLNRTDQGMDLLYPTVAGKGPRGVSTSIDAMASEEAFRDYVLRTFGMDAGRLADRLIGMVPDGAQGDQRYIGPLVLATALCAQCHHDPLQLFEELKDGHDTPARFAVERALASSAAGLQMIAAFRGLEAGDERLAMFSDMMRISSALEQKAGTDVSEHDSVRTLIEGLADKPELRSMMGYRIGEDHDDERQLLAKALRYVHCKFEGTDLQNSDLGAFMAWKKGGFTESGKGTDFNKAIGRMHKFLTYVERAEHGDRNLSNIAWDVRSYFHRAMGIGKSPLSAMRHGTWGGHRGLAEDEQRNLKAALNVALDKAYESVHGELHDYDLLHSPKRLPLAARAAVFDLWRNSSGSNVFSLSDVKQRVAELLPEATPDSIDDKQLKRALKQFTRLSRQDGEMKVSITVKALEAVAAQGNGAPALTDAEKQRLSELRGQQHRTVADVREMNALQARRRAEIHTALGDVRQAAQVDIEPKPLFVWSDIKRLLRGADARPGPDANHAKEVMKKMAAAPHVGTASYADGASHGLGAFGSVALQTSSATGVPIVYPVIEADRGHAAMVSVGNYTTGARLFVGKETSYGGSLGIGGGWSAVPPGAKGILSVGGFGEASVSQHRGTMEGLSITAHNDQPGWRDSLPKVIDFLFAEGKKSTNRVANPSHLWERFATQFENDPHVSVSWTHETSAATNVQAGVFGTARVGTPVSRVGVGVRVGYSYDSFEATHAHGTPGGDVPTSMRGTITNMTAGVAAGETAPGKAFSGRLAGSWGLLAPLAGVSAEAPDIADIGISRLGRNRDGELSAPLCQREIMFGSGATMIEYIEHNRAAWEKALSQPDARGETMPSQAQKRLDDFIQTLAKTQSPVSLSGELTTLAPEAAARINGLEAQIKALRSPRSAQATGGLSSNRVQEECRLLENKVREILAEQNNWLPAALYTADEDGKSVNTGLAFGLRVVNHESGLGLHVTSLLAAGPATPAEPAVADSPRGEQQGNAGASAPATAAPPPAGRRPATSARPPSAAPDGGQAGRSPAPAGPSQRPRATDASAQAAAATPAIAAATRARRAAARPASTPPTGAPVGQRPSPAGLPRGPQSAGASAPGATAAPATAAPARPMVRRAAAAPDPVPTPSSAGPTQRTQAPATRPRQEARATGAPAVMASPARRDNRPASTPSTPSTRSADEASPWVPASFSPLDPFRDPHEPLSSDWAKNVTWPSAEPRMVEPSDSSTSSSSVDPASARAISPSSVATERTRPSRPTFDDSKQIARTTTPDETPAHPVESKDDETGFLAIRPRRPGTDVDLDDRPMQRPRGPAPDQNGHTTRAPNLPVRPDRS